MNLFFATKRGKFAIFFFVIGLCGLFSDPFGSFCCITLALLLVFPEIIYLVIPADHWWNIWKETLSSNAQKTRMNRAMTGELTPKHVDTKCKNAVFVGSEGGKYLTTLKKCTCPDFQKRGVPCKHMFYLANEMNLLDLKQVNWDDI